MKSTSESGYNSAFATKLRDLLEKNSISKTKLANDLGVKQQTISQWADGSTTPALKHLKPLALYFNVTIDEMVTGVAPSNEELHLNTGLSNRAIEILKQLNGGDRNNKIHNQIIIEFLNVIIENMDSELHNSSRLALHCMNYIIGAHEPILEQERLKEQKAEGWVIFTDINRPNMKNDDLDFRTYRLTKDFEYFIEHLTRDAKIVERAKKIYMEGNLYLPDYSDRRFKS